MSDHSDSDSRSSVDEEDEDVSLDEESPELDSLDGDEQDQDDEADEEDEDEGNEDEEDVQDGEENEDEDHDEEEDAGKCKKSSEAASKDDSKDAQDVTNVALERTIFVGNLPSNLSHKDVAKLFKACGPVESARIRNVVPEKEKLSPKVALITQRIHKKVDSVNAYVVFAKTESDESIKKALAMNGTVIDDHHIRVDKAQQANSKRLTLTSRKKSVFVGNLRFDMRDDDLINHFEKCGSVDYVRLVRDRATGLGKGFGFVKFLERAAVKKALELDDTDFKGRKLRVKKIDEKMKLDDVDDKKKQKSAKNNHPQKQSPTRPFGNGTDGPVEDGYMRRKNTEQMKRKNSDQSKPGGFKQSRPNNSNQEKRNSFGHQENNSNGSKRNNFDGPKRNNFNGPKRNSFDQSKRNSFNQPKRNDFDQSGRNSFGDKQKNFDRTKRDAKSNGSKKRVKFDLKNTKSSNDQQKREGPQFDKVKVNKMNKKKAKTILKKKVKKEFMKG